MYVNQRNLTAEGGHSQSHSLTKSFTHYKGEYLKTTSKREVRVITLCRFCVLSHFQLKNGDDQVLGAKVLSQFHKLFPIQ